jgi:hypothetical protein
MEQMIVEERPMTPIRRGLFGLRRALHKYRELYFARREMARRAIEQDARRWNGEVTWRD